MKEEKLKLLYLLENTSVSSDSFRYKNYYNQDIGYSVGMKSNDYNTIKYDYEKDIFEIKYVEEIIKKVYSKHSGSSTTKDKLIGLYTFEELKESEYYQDILQRFEKCKTSNVDYFIEHYEEPNFKFNKDSLIFEFENNNILIKINTIKNEIKIETDNTNYKGIINKLKTCHNDDWLELIDCEKLYNKITSKVNDFKKIENGYLINNRFFETIDDYLYFEEENNKEKVEI